MRRGVNSPPEFISDRVANEVAEAQQKDRDAIFHGKCLGCIWKKGNNQGEGLRFCIGCAYSTFNNHMPNRYIGTGR